MDSGQAVTIYRNAGTAMVTFDLREKLIPFSLLEITNVFRRMQPGEEMEILASNCPVQAAIFKDVMRILPRKEYDRISQQNVSEADSVTRMIIRKKQSMTNQQPKGDSSCQPQI